DGSEKMPVVIHRAIYGSLERFIGIIIENFKGVFPFWLNPYQVAVVPIREDHNDYAREISKKLVENGVRVEADYSDKNMRSKIKEFKLMKDPYIVVIGDKEVENNTVSINIRGTNKQVADVDFDRFLEVCKKLNAEHTLELVEEF
ncbi:MAG: His/Gly/Thr/Pro-type tRNA ligase C-terminal domain-containing protein, partial [Anaerococcus sp.]|nr:His/Gly/Thr/Pro-type tRNA ligase C-terminal domain-containing protein [Anaerococcus sp.]